MYLVRYINKDRFIDGLFLPRQSLLENMLPSDDGSGHHHDIESTVDTLSISDQSSIHQQRSPQRPFRGRQPRTPSTRRASAMLYAEKYGLKSPVQQSDNADLSGEEDDEDEDDDRPLSYQVPLSSPPPHRAAMIRSSPTLTSLTKNNGIGRPVSVRNVAETTNSARPARFIKPSTQQLSNVAAVPSDMQHVQRLYEHYRRKVYMEGYLRKKNDLTVDGKPCGDYNWTRWYVELCGPVLTMWDAESREEETNVLPQYINVTDSYVDLVGDTLNGPNSQQQHIFALNSAGSNRYLLEAEDEETAAAWVRAIRLSCFEASRIHEIYTRQFVTRSTYSDVLVKRPAKTEGWLQVRFPGSTDWQKYWAVVTDRRQEKKLFGKKSVPGRGQLMFYESKKAKLPVMNIVNVVQAYTVYPESPQLVDLASLMKVEGNMYTTKTNGEQQLFRLSASALIMASNAKELVQWLVGTFDAFKLYGRPTRLLDDPTNIHSLNFGEPRFDIPRLFLELSEVSQVDVSVETLVDNKVAFAGILQNKLRAQAAAVPPPSNGRVSSMPLLSGIPQTPTFLPDSRRRTVSSGQLPHVETTTSIRAAMTRSSTQFSSLAGTNARERASMMSVGPQQQRGSQNNIYASDSSNDDEEEEEDEEESDSGDSVFYSKKKQHSQPSAPSQTQGTAAGEKRLSVPLASDSSQSASETSSKSSVSSATPTDTSRRKSTITLPEIQETTDFASSILGSVEARSENTRKSPTLQNASSLPLSPESSSSSSLSSSPAPDTSSTPLESLIDAYKKHGLTANVNGNANTSSNEKKETNTAKQPMGGARPASAIMGKRYPSGLIRPQSSLSGSGSSAASQSSASASGSETSSRVMPRQRPASAMMNQRPMYSAENGRRSTSNILQLHHPQQQQQQQQQWETMSDGPGMMMNGPLSPMMQYDSMYSPTYGGGSQYGYPYEQNRSNDQGPIIPQLGEHFATQNSLLDMYRPDQPPARLQEEYARATGQPLVNLPDKKTPQPRTGLVGMISQLEDERKERESVKGRLLEMEKERALEREKERYLMNQRQSSMMQPPASPPPQQQQVKSL